MIKLFLEAWAIQSLDWRIFYTMSIGFVSYITFEILKMIVISYKLKKAEKEYNKTFVSQLDDMYQKLEAGIEINPSKYLK